MRSLRPVSARTLLPVALCAICALVLPGSSAGRAVNATHATEPHFASRLPLNPVVQSLVDSVSIERLEESVQTLVDFYTRQTNSDTVSATTGIGAARRWIHDQFAAYSTAHGGAQATGYYDWTGSPCSIAGTHRNVLAVQTGDVYPERYFIIGAHLDSRTINGCNAVSFAPGADDDGSGCATALELAYLLSQIDTESSVIYTPVTGEEQGLLGSTAYAEEAALAGMDIAGMIAVDTIGNIEDIVGNVDSTTCRMFSGAPATSSSRQLARYMKLKGEAYQPDFTVNLIPLLDRVGRGGDHIPFYNNGYPSARIMETLENGDGSGANGHQHNGTDLPENMDFRYCRRIVRVNVAGLASMALAPRSPVGVDVYDAGNGTEVLVSWAPNSEADLAGYRVTFRFEEGDSLYYQEIVDTGLTESVTLTGLDTDVAILVSVSAYDTEANESVFGDEQRIIPAVLPLMPANFGATSRANRIELDWEPNLELDIHGYNLYRSDSPGGTYALLGFVPHPTTHVEDLDVTASTPYYYQLRATDTALGEGPAAGPVKGRLVDHGLGVLIVDGTPDGTGIFNPPDAPVDLFYAGMLSEVGVAGEWDRADSMAVGIALSDADLGAHRGVVYHVDSSPPTPTTAADTTALRKYLQNGGRVLLSATRVNFTLGGSTDIVSSWGAGDFMHDVLQATEVRESQEFDLAGVFSQMSGYPDLDVDISKVIFDRLPMQIAHTGPLAGQPTTEILYHFQSNVAGPNHNLPNAIRFLSPEMRLVAFSFPLYFMDSLSVRQTISAALDNLDLGTTAVDPAVAANPRLTFGLVDPRPNPFNPSTRIAFVADRLEPLRLRIFDVQGRHVRTLIDGLVEPGRHVITWDGRHESGHSMRSGVFFLELEGATSRQVDRRKLVMLR